MNSLQIFSTVHEHQSVQELLVGFGGGHEVLVDGHIGLVGHGKVKHKQDVMGPVGNGSWGKKLTTNNIREIR